MYWRISPWLRASAGLLALGALGWACGPFFGISVMTGNQRKTTVLAAPAFDYLRQLETLVPKPTRALPLATPLTADDDPNAADTDYDSRYFIERIAGGSKGREAAARAMRLAADGPSAYAVSAGLPEAVRLYGAGAVSFAKRQWPDAARYFSAVLALPPDQRKLREVMALFMLGRVERLAGDSAKAKEYFRRTRDAAAAGPDLLGLGIASLGEDARLELDAGNVARAVRLYAEQAAYGDDGGTTSLMMAAREILAKPALVDLAVQDATARRLLILHVTARGDGTQQKALLAGLQRQKVAVTAGAGLLAADSYARGDFTAAARWAELEKSAASAWVKAKLAWRAGDEDAALREYSAAVAALRTPGPDNLRVNTLESEIAIARVRRGEYRQALELLLRHAKDGPYGDYWMDVAYLAERVLTTSELKSFVDAKVAAPASYLPPPPNSYEAPPANVAVRALLARRLLRDGRFDEALAYFDDRNHRESARTYADARRRATSAWFQVSRAEAWRDAARLARHNGMEILAYEANPDFAAFGGNYELGSPEEQPELPLTPGEAKRLSATRPPMDRFHYRHIAANHALEAAALVPARSEGFAAVLCEATGWVAHRDPAKAAQLYGRYKREGAYVRWAGAFGSQCPDVALESEWQWRTRLTVRKAARRFGADWLMAGALAAGTLLIGGSLYVWRRRTA